VQVGWASCYEGGPAAQVGHPGTSDRKEQDGLEGVRRDRGRKRFPDALGVVEAGSWWC